jgi:type IV secretory pathway TraG/TraD family ATPase VirD4
MSKAISTTIAPQSPSSNNHPLPLDLTSTALLCGCIGLMVFAKLASGGGRGGQQGRAYWGGKRELQQAAWAAKQQIRDFNPKFKSSATCALYIGTPDRIYHRHRQEFYDANQEALESQIQTLAASEDPTERTRAQDLIDRYRPSSPKLFGKKTKSLYFPNLNRGTAVFGSAGTGKSFSILNPLLRSAMDQKIHCLLWDFKYPEQTADVVGYAALRGYNVQIFAPSFLETQILNICDFVKDSGDALGAAQLAKVLVKNSSMDGGNKGGGNEFFEAAGATVVQSAIMLAKWLEEDPLAARIAQRIWQGERPPLADLMSAAAIVNLPALSSRMGYAQHRINPWNVQEFAQLVSTGGGTEGGKTNVTEAGVIANAQKTLNQVVKRDFIPAICGKSTIDIELVGERPTLTIIGLNQDYRDVLTPLLATVIDLIVSHNVAHARQRKSPLFVSLDELPTLYLPKIANWLSEARSAGFCGAIGLQNPSQLQNTYGDKMATTILANCATKFILNPQDVQSAESYSKLLGEREHSYKTITHTYQKGGRSRSINEHITKVPLMEAQEFNKMDVGRAITISPDYRNGKQKTKKGSAPVRDTKDEAYIPIKIDISLPERDIASVGESKEVWQNMRYRAQAQNQATAKDELALAREYDRRRALVEALFPPPPPKKLKAPLKSLIQHLLKAGYVDGDNFGFDPSHSVYVPLQWRDPNSPDDDVRVLIPQDEAGLESVCVVVQSNGYKIQPSN